MSYVKVQKVLKIGVEVQVETLSERLFKCYLIWLFALSWLLYETRYIINSRRTIPFHVIADAFKMAVRDRECKGLESKYVSKRWKCFRKFEVSVTVEQSVHGVSETTHLAFDTDNLLFVRKNLATAFCNVVCTCINVPCVEFSKYLYSL